MTLHEDLFGQARALASFDSNKPEQKKPKQADLRRAVSSAYYGVFHALVHHACCVSFGAAHQQAAYRYVLGRAFVHSAMKQACNSFRGGTLKASVVKGLPLDHQENYAVLPEIQDIAATFVELQEKRHTADYDLTERFERSDVLTVVEQAESHVTSFAQLAMSDEKRFFLSCLWAWKELANR